jgi:hypothetical protein
MSIDVVKINKMLQKLPEARHSYFQMKYFIIGKEPTVQAQLWKCLRELKVKKDAMDSIYLEMEDLKDQIELLTIHIEREEIQYTFTDVSNTKLIDLANQEKAIKIRQNQRKERILKSALAKCEENLKYLEQETRFFIQTYEALEKIEPLKDYDDEIAQKEYWNEKLSQEVGLKILLQQPIDIEVAKTVLALHDDAPIKLRVVKLLNDTHARLEKNNAIKKEANVSSIESKRS